MSDHYDRYNGMDNLLGTNLAEVGTVCISREQAIDALKQQADTMSRWSERYAEQRKGVLTAVNIVEDLPTIQPTDNLQKLADEIASFKRCFNSENSDYLTGYLSALSVVEGMIADMREVNHE